MRDDTYLFTHPPHPHTKYLYTLIAHTSNTYKDDGVGFAGNKKTKGQKERKGKITLTKEVKKKKKINK